MLCRELRRQMMEYEKFAMGPGDNKEKTSQKRLFSRPRGDYKLPEPFLSGIGAIYSQGNLTALTLVSGRILIVNLADAPPFLTRSLSTIHHFRSLSFIIQTLLEPSVLRSLPSHQPTNTAFATTLHTRNRILCTPSQALYALLHKAPIPCLQLPTSPRRP